MDGTSAAEDIEELRDKVRSCEQQVAEFNLAVQVVPNMTPILNSDYAHLV